MQVGIFYMPTAYTADVVTLARRVEALGFESLWVPDHPVMPVERTSPFPGGGEMPDVYAHLMDPLVTLAAAAGATERIRLGTGIVLAAEREPLVLAKEAATLDLVSNGRFELGVGAGWQREEAEILGVHWKRRWAHVREHVLAMKACWRDGLAEFHGEYVTSRRCGAIRSRCSARILRSSSRASSRGRRSGSWSTATAGSPASCG